MIDNQLSGENKTQLFWSHTTKKKIVFISMPLISVSDAVYFPYRKTETYL